MSISLLIIALIVSYSRMLLTLQQTWWLTGIALGAGALSSLAFGLMTLPITRSVQRLVQFADNVADLSFHTELTNDAGPAELRQLANSLKTMAQCLSASFEQLERMELKRRELIANVSHDLRTPLASIQSCVEALQDKVVTNPNEIESYLHTIHTETRRLSTLIHDLFELSKLEAGQEPLDASLTHLDQVLAEALDSHRMLFREKGITVSVEMPDGLPPMYLSPEKIHRVISNLLQNAIRHSPDYGTIQVCVTRLHAGAIEVSVQDEGPGVNLDDAERLFERFYRTDQSRTRNSGGAGLGLAMLNHWCCCIKATSGCGTETTVGQGPCSGSHFRLRTWMDCPKTRRQMIHLRKDFVRISIES
jgi:two-component system, OmpR family, sensor histidine kinase SaeS